ncbi:MAG: YwiC-like family protein [Micropruina sp.]|uniref:YwiC-like family protein n=1 Tax=Micropruina sp. TaxID=2737536 RepID=UPI0039E70030
MPNQHGAWAMLAVPIAAGIALRTPVATHVPLLAACCVLGYFAFHAASRWLKSPPARRARYLPATLVYTVTTVAAGAGAVLLGGWPLLGWLAVFAALLAPALQLALARRERALLGGALTTAAACLIPLALAYPSPAELLTDWPDARAAVLLSATLFGYFFGTVLHVKSLIRERGNTRLERVSLAWQLAWAIAAAALWGGPTGWLWAAIFGLATVRTVVLARLARRRPVRPIVIGMIEIGLSVLVLAGALWTASHPAG